MTAKKSTLFEEAPLLESLASVNVTLICLALAMVIILIGTLAQVKMGTFAAQKVFFNSWILYARLGGVKIPVFVGGLAVGAAWMVNLVAAFLRRFTFRRRDAGILLSHFGLIVLLAGQFLTQTLAHESTMPIELGQTMRYSETLSDPELALVDTSNPQKDIVTSVPYSIFSRSGHVDLPGLPFSILIRRFYANAQVEMNTGGDENLATQGIGTRVRVRELPPTSSDEEVNNATAYVDILDNDHSLGTWLVSAGLGAPQFFTIRGHEFHLFVRPRRHYYPFAVTLKEFRHDSYPGTDIPKNFSSLVHLENPAAHDSRDALLYMNHPLRYQGITFIKPASAKTTACPFFKWSKILPLGLPTLDASSLRSDWH